MAHKSESSPFAGFGTITLSKSEEAGVFILAIYRDGNLTAAAHATERGAIEAAVEYLDDERDEEEGGALEDGYARVQQIISDDGGMMEIIASPVHGA